MIYFGIIVFLLLVLLGYFGFVFSNKVIVPKTLSLEDAYITNIEMKNIDSVWFESLKYEDVFISSPYGYELHGRFFPLKNSKKTVIISHGVGQNIYSSVKYMKLFYSRGFNILLYDHRNHGNSGGKHTTFGYYEKYDLVACTDWVLNRCGFDCKVGIHGESMGAAIALQNSAIDPRIVFYIVDCPLSDLNTLLGYRLKVDYKMPSFPLINVSSFISRIRAGFYFGQVSPIMDIANVDTPIFFIHGKEDTYILPKMSEEMYNIKKGKKKLYLADGARHAESCISNYEEYDRLVGEFLEEVHI